MIQGRTTFFLLSRYAAQRYLLNTGRLLFRLVVNRALIIQSSQLLQLLEFFLIRILWYSHALLRSLRNRQKVSQIVAANCIDFLMCPFVSVSQQSQRQNSSLHDRTKIKYFKLIVSRPQFNSKHVKRKVALFFVRCVSFSQLQDVSWN